MITLPNVIQRDVFSARPAAGAAGHLFFASDTGRQYRDNGATWDEITPSAGLLGVVGITIDGGGSAITTGQKGFIQVPFAGTIIGWSAVADQSGSLTVEVDRHSSSAPPTAPMLPNTTTDKLSASAPVELSAAQAAAVAAAGVSTWAGAGAVAQWDVIGFNVTSAATITRATISLYVQRG